MIIHIENEEIYVNLNKRNQIYKTSCKSFKFKRNLIDRKAITRAAFFNFNFQINTKTGTL